MQTLSSNQLLDLPLVAKAKRISPTLWNAPGAPVGDVVAMDTQSLGKLGRGAFNLDCLVEDGHVCSVAHSCGSNANGSFTMMRFMDTVSKRIKYARGLRQWNQRQLGLAAGLTGQAIGNIEAEVREGKGSLPQIAEALGVSYKWLAYGTGEMLEKETRNAIVHGLHPELSAHARELGEMFDLIPASKRIERAMAYTEAMRVIVSVLEGRAIDAQAWGSKTQSTDTPAPQDAKR